VAKVLAARVQGKDIEWYSPETICFSLVNADPLEGISWMRPTLMTPRPKRSPSPKTPRCSKIATPQGPWNTLMGEGMYRICSINP